jgi:hypothetical protein
VSNIVQISFRGSYDEPSPFVTIYNPGVLPAALISQVQRFGLIKATDKALHLSGQLKGNRKAFTELIQTYGVTVEVVPPLQ